jgi:hypothetical protein
MSQSKGLPETMSWQTQTYHVAQLLDEVVVLNRRGVALCAESVA